MHCCKYGNSKNLGNDHDQVEIISSLDSPFAIKDALVSYLKRTKNCLKIVCPFIGKDFIDILRSTLRKGVVIKLFTREPKSEDDRTFLSVEALLDEAKSTGWNCSVRCASRFLPHQKLIIIDDSFVITGSMNPTLSGIHYNDEILYIFKNHHHVARINEIFEKLWLTRKSIPWELLKSYQGFSYDRQFELHRRIADEIYSFFQRNGNKPVKKYELCQELLRVGCSFGDVKKVIRYLINKGLLYEPKPDYIRWVSNNSDV